MRAVPTAIAPCRMRVVEAATVHLLHVKARARQNEAACDLPVCRLLAETRQRARLTRGSPKHQVVRIAANPGWRSRELVSVLASY
jgi:hypothetical protein